ncbi:retrovirus-related pol polyprotein from transposon TNT 1-94 [Tanacetum coccineum]|uniref:Retrovirus-related pol polyprotein from transposon TNT 1-94 n=1 Tax=Tanacetum coccineum TaxID=301880 RepID=A0ABQ5GJ52_9ASTR
MIHRRHGKTPYELLHDKPLDLSYLHVFGALCYPTNDSENLGKLQPKADIGIFIGYTPTKKAFRIYNRHTRRIIETIHVDFDELTAMASKHSSSGPALHEMTPVSISSGLVSNPPSSTPFVPPLRSDWDLLFQPMFDESLNSPPYVDLQALEVIAPIPEAVAPEHAVSTAHHPHNKDNHDIKVALWVIDYRTLVFQFQTLLPDQSSSSDVIPIQLCLPSPSFLKHNSKWTKDHPLENIIGALDRSVSTRLQLHEQALFYNYDAFLTSELHEFERLEVWELVPPPDKAFVISLKDLKVSLNELVCIQKNRLVDPTLFIRREGKELLLVHIYADDIIFAASTPEFCDLFAKIMCSEFKMAKDGKYGYELCDPVDYTMLEKSKLDEIKMGKLSNLTLSEIAAISSTEAEYIALSGCCAQINDIDIRFHFIKEHVENGVIELYFVNTEYQLADIFTKALGRERIEFLINKQVSSYYSREPLKKLADDVDE